MSLITAFLPRRRTAPAEPSALDRVVAQFARSHAMHITPILGCYQCLHGEPRIIVRELAAAA